MLSWWEMDSVLGSLRMKVQGSSVGGLRWAGGSCSSLFEPRFRVIPKLKCMGRVEGGNQNVRRVVKTRSMNHIFLFGQ